VKAPGDSAGDEDGEEVADAIEGVKVRTKKASALIDLMWRDIMSDD
jgi:hypothetical protein